MCLQAHEQIKAEPGGRKWVLRPWESVTWSQPIRVFRGHEPRWWPMNGLYSYQVSFRSVSLPGRLDPISIWGDIKFWVFSSRILFRSWFNYSWNFCGPQEPAGSWLLCQGATQLQDPDLCVGVYRARGVLGNSVPEGGSERSRDHLACWCSELIWCWAMVFQMKEEAEKVSGTKASHLNKSRC